MPPTFRIVALAAALSALLPAAHAAQVNLNFDALGVTAVDQNAPQAFPGVGSLQFGNAFVYGVGMLFDCAGLSDPCDISGLKNGSGGRGGLLLNRGRGAGASTQDILISLVQGGSATTPSVFFEKIVFDLFSKGSSNKVIGTTADGRSIEVPLTGGGLDVWSPGATADFTGQNVTSLRLTAGISRFALDNMQIFLTDSTTPSVPEPASYGLVGLALLAAGAASRRRQRG